MVPEESLKNLGKAIQKDLGVEWGMPLMVRFEGFSDSYKGILAGMDRGHYLICNIPQIKNIWVKVNKETQVVVRYLHKGVVYGFQCHVISVIGEPVPLMLLSYPEEIETVALRKNDRITCLIPATVQVDGWSSKGAILDLSLGGCSFVCTPSPESESSKVEKGIDAVMTVQIPGSPNERTIELGIVNVRREDHRITIGSQFKNLDTDGHNAIESYVQTMAALCG